MDTRNESQAVNDYKQHSDIYKNTLKAAVFIKNMDQNEKDKLQALANATTFSEMISIADRYDIGNVPYWANVGINTLVSVSSYFSAGSNFMYYALRLKSDIVSYAVEKGYHRTETNNNLLY